MSGSPTAKTWFITGTSRGLGRAWATAALERGDRVVATARDVRALDGLVARFGDAVLALPLDVTDRAAVFATVARAHERFGRLDVVVNNAGYGQFGMVEELSEREARDQLDTNLFGPLWVAQAALPFLRAQAAGHVLQVSSIGGLLAIPDMGIYHASKWALEGLTQALAQEVAEFGVRVTLIEPGSFATDWGGPSARRAAASTAYAVQHATATAMRAAGSAVAGDPAASAAAVLRIVDADDPPLRCLLGSVPLAMAEAEYARRLATWRQWQPVAELAQGAPRD